MAMEPQGAPDIAGKKQDKNNLKRQAEKRFQDILQKHSNGQLVVDGEKIRSFREAVKLATQQAREVFPSFTPKND